MDVEEPDGLQSAPNPPRHTSPVPGYTVSIDEPDAATSSALPGGTQPTSLAMSPSHFHTPDHSRRNFSKRYRPSDSHIHTTSPPGNKSPLDYPRRASPYPKHVQPKHKYPFPVNASPQSLRPSPGRLKGSFRKDAWIDDDAAPVTKPISPCISQGTSQLKTPSEIPAQSSMQQDEELANMSFSSPDSSPQPFKELPARTKEPVSSKSLSNPPLMHLSPENLDVVPEMSPTATDSFMMAQGSLPCRSMITEPDSVNFIAAQPDKTKPPGAAFSQGVSSEVTTPGKLPLSHPHSQAISPHSSSPEAESPHSTSQMSTSPDISNLKLKESSQFLEVSRDRPNIS